MYTLHSYTKQTALISFYITLEDLV